MEEIGQFENGEYTAGFIDGLMAMAKAAKLDFEQNGSVFTVTDPKTKRVVLRFTVKEMRAASR